MLQGQKSYWKIKGRIVKPTARDGKRKTTSLPRFRWTLVDRRMMPNKTVATTEKYILRTSYGDHADFFELSRVAIAAIEAASSLW